MEGILGELVEKLARAFGDRLVSVVLYGSAAIGDTPDRFSDYNVLCVLPQVTPAELAVSEPIFRWWREMGNPAPLLVSEAEVGAAADCFPIEYRDIQDRHRLLHGRDVVSNIAVSSVYYRAQVEHALRSALFRLRTKAAGVLGERDLLLRLMAESVSTFCVLMRHALRLHGQEPRYSKREVVLAGQEHLGLQADPFLTLLDLREGKVKPRSVQPVLLLTRYLHQVQGLVESVDRLEIEAGSKGKEDR